MNTRSAHQKTLCDHCGIPCTEAIITETINQVPHSFCCHGCSGAYRIITGAGLQDFYKRRSWQEPGVPDTAFAQEYTENQLAPFIRQTDAGSELLLLIEGIRCASCIWLIEKLLIKIPGVERARLNFSSHRLIVTFEPSQIQASEILAAISRIGYLARPYTRSSAMALAAREKKSLLLRFGTAAFFSMQLMVYSLALYAGYFQGIDPTARRFLQFLAALVTTPVVFYAGFPFLQGGWRSLKNAAPNMDLLISLGVLSAYGYSLLAVVKGKEVYFDTAAMIVTLLLLGRLFENAAKGKASEGIDRLLALIPDHATRISENGALQQINSHELERGDRILVKPGERFPVDGEISHGETEVDEAIISGESVPVLRRQGMEILSGSINLLAGVEVIVRRTAPHSFVARIASLVEKAQTRKAPIQSLADRISVIFIPLVIACAFATFLYWQAHSAEISTPLLHAVTILVVACPCALGLATPTAVLVATAAAAAKGILFRGGDTLEATASISLAGFDKTGTLSTGSPRVSAILPANGTQAELLELAASIESSSAHPLARGIIHKAQELSITFSPLSGAESLAGRGLTVKGPRGTIRAGNRAFLASQGVSVPETCSTDQTEVHLALDSLYKGVILLEDPLRLDAAATIATLKALNIRCRMLTGDHERAAAHAADQLNIDFCSGMSPLQKAQWVEQQQAAGHHVLMVGDGINDAPALAAAAVGCAMAGGTDIALESSELALTRPDLQRLVAAILIARKTMRIIRQNLFWAFFYNLLMIPLAASGHLMPIYGAGAMAFSSIAVVCNSLRLASVKTDWPRR